MTTVSIRPATPADSAALLQMMRELARFGDHEAYVTAREEQLAAQQEEA